MPTRFDFAPEVLEIAHELIPQYHRHLQQLEVRVSCLWRDDIPMTGGREVFGTPKKISGANAFEGNQQQGGRDYFRLEVSKPLWIRKSDRERRAEVDKLLCACWAAQDENGVKLSILKPDVEEYFEIACRHGVWNGDLRQLLENLGESGDQAA